MAYTEFYCDASAGNNMNGGAPIGGSYPFTYTNGAWNSGTLIYTPSGGHNPQSDGVSVGDFAAVFTDGSTTPGYIARVTAVSTTTITLSGAATIGSVPTTGASGITIKVGGAWKGPTGASVTWPVGNVTNGLTNSSINPPRINFKNNATYSPTTALSNGNADVTFEGYSSSPGDGGMAAIDWGGNAVTLFTLSVSASCQLKSLILSNVGVSSGSNNGLSIAGNAAIIRNVVVHDVRGSGFNAANGGCVIADCEAYNCNLSNTANLAGFMAGANCTFLRCNSHDHAAGSNAHGFVTTVAVGSAMCLVNCLADNVGGVGAKASGSGMIVASGCDFFETSNQGLDVSTGLGQCYAENCNFIKNSSGAVNTPASGNAPCIVNGCGFGAGSYNPGTQVSNRAGQNLNPITYANDLTPYSVPATIASSTTVTLPAGHGLQSGTTEMAWSSSNRRTGMTGTVSGNTLTLSGGAGTAYPSNGTTVNVSVRGDFNLRLPAAIGSLGSAAGAALTSFQQTAGAVTGYVAGIVARDSMGSVGVGNYPAVANVITGDTYANAAYVGTAAAGGIIEQITMSGGING